MSLQSGMKGKPVKHLPTLSLVLLTVLASDAWAAGPDVAKSATVAKPAPAATSTKAAVAMGPVKQVTTTATTSAPAGDTKPLNSMLIAVTALVLALGVSLWKYRKSKKKKGEAEPAKLDPGKPLQPAVLPDLSKQTLTDPAGPDKTPPQT